MGKSSRTAAGAPAPLAKCRRAGDYRKGSKMKTTATAGPLTDESILKEIDEQASVWPGAVRLLLQERRNLLAALEDWAEWATNRDIPFELISKTRLAIAAARGRKVGTP